MFAVDLDVRAERATRFPATLGNLLADADSDEVRRRPAPAIWSPIEYAAHTGDAVHWYVERIYRVLREDRPKLAPFDWDLATEQRDYRRRSIPRVLAAVEQACSEFTNLARSLNRDDLQKTGVGSDGSPRTVEVLLGRADHELVHHEMDIRRGLCCA